MEQKGNLAYRFEARVRKTDGSEEPFLVEITEPGPGRSEWDRACGVRCSLISDRWHWISNVDDRSAVENAVHFVRSYLKHGEDKVVDGDGNEVPLPDPR